MAAHVAPPKVPTGAHTGALRPAKGQGDLRSNSNSTPTGFVGMYDFRGTLGKGHFAVVKLAEHVLSKLRVAVKIIDKNKLQPDELEHLHHEVRVMKLIRHPHIIRLYQVHNTNNKLYLILELGSGGDLYEYLNKNGKLEEGRARKLFRQIAQAMSYCHQHRVAHRDLKPENVVFCTAKNGEEVVKVTDFGLSNNFAPGEKMKTACGSLVYTCPEILLGDPYDGPQADIWSLGVILYMMICGKLPFQEHSDTATLIKIMDVIYKQPEHVSEDCRSLLARMLVREPSERAKMSEILEHPWLALTAEEAASAASKPRAVPAEASAAVTRQQLTNEEHDAVLRTMEEAGMERDNVLQSLDANNFDYFTSTYCLLAERELRRRTRIHSRSNGGDGAGAKGGAGAAAAAAAAAVHAARGGAGGGGGGGGGGSGFGTHSPGPSPRALRRNHTIHGHKPSRTSSSSGGEGSASGAGSRRLRPAPLPHVPPMDGRSGSFDSRPSSAMPLGADKGRKTQLSTAQGAGAGSHGGGSRLTVHFHQDHEEHDGSDHDEMESPRRCSVLTTTGQHTGSLRKPPAMRRASMHEHLGLSPRFSSNMQFDLGASPSSADASPGLRPPRNGGGLGMPILQRARSGRSKGTRHHRHSTTLGAAVPLRLSDAEDDDDDDEDEDEDDYVCSPSGLLRPPPAMTAHSRRSVADIGSYHENNSGSDHSSEDGPEQSLGEPESPHIVKAPQVMDISEDAPEEEGDNSVFAPPQDDHDADRDVLMVPSVQRTVSIPNDLAAKGTEVHCIMEEDEEDEEEV